ncbi:hypothetical protein SK128_012071 [Halocaridina rubra]|uniref:Uncharacterized protein n=1 Tax=Halocaridina rubra TaxID=373956 RepID=A0AAN9ABX4_HALRR
MISHPMKIHLKDNAVPFAIHMPRSIPFAIQSLVKEELDLLVMQGIIKPADALYGYWEMEHGEEDRHLTTFIIPCSKFKLSRGPMGFTATGDAFYL